MDKKLVNQTIREVVLESVKIEEREATFQLYGRGHEPRVSLDLALASVLRNCAIPRVTISGYGPNNFYPARVFERARKTLIERLGWSPIVFSSVNTIHGGVIYLDYSDSQTDTSRNS